MSTTPTLTIRNGNEVAGGERERIIVQHSSGPAASVKRGLSVEWQVYRGLWKSLEQKDLRKMQSR